jgi:hypothetical protein
MDTILFIPTPTRLPLPQEKKAWGVQIGVAFAVCLVAIGLYAVSRLGSKSPSASGIQPQTNGATRVEVTGAFGWKLGEQLKGTGAQWVTNDIDGSLFVSVYPEENQGGFSSVDVYATKEGIIYRISASANDHSASYDYYDQRRILIQTLTEKYGTPRSGTLLGSKTYDFGNEKRRVRLEANEKSHSLEISYEDVPIAEAQLVLWNTKREQSIKNSTKGL